MCMPERMFLREPLPEERQELPPELSGNGFRLIAHSQKIYLPTGAPAFFFDVLSDAGDKVGIANVIVEPDRTSVASVGNLCAMLSEECLNVELLSKVADTLIGYSFDAGLPEVLIVVPVAHAPSTEACTLLRPASSTIACTKAGEDAIAYTYRRAR